MIVPLLTKTTDLSIFADSDIAMRASVLRQHTVQLEGHTARIDRVAVLQDLSIFNSIHLAPIRIDRRLVVAHQGRGLFGL